MLNQILEMSLDEAEKNNFIVLPGKGEHSGFMPCKIVYPHLGGFDGEFYSSGSWVGMLIRPGCAQGLHSSKVVSDNLLDELLWFLASCDLSLIWRMLTP